MKTAVNTFLLHKNVSDNNTRQIRKQTSERSRPTSVWATRVTHPAGPVVFVAALLLYLAAAFSSPPDDFTPRSMTPSLVLSGRLWKDAFSVPVSMVSV